MWIVRLALRRPYTFVVMSMAIVILGVLAIMRMPTDIFPETPCRRSCERPTVTSMTPWTSSIVLPPSPLIVIARSIFSDFTKGLYRLWLPLIFSRHAV